MKKIVLLLGLFLLTTTASIAGNCGYTCVSPYDTSSKITAFFTNITGVNFIKTKIVEKIIRTSFSKISQNSKNLKIDLDSSSSADLNKGIFKSLSISGKETSIEGVYLTSFELKSLCEFNYVKYDKSGNLTFKEDFPMSFHFVMSADDINRTLEGEKYSRILTDLNKLSFAGVRVTSTKAVIRGDKFYYIVYVSIPFIRKEQTLTISSDIHIKDGKIDYENARLTANSFNLDLKKVDFIMNYLDPLDFSVHIFDNRDARICVKNLSIEDNLIHIKGTAVIPKD